jgi:hypothetical protein
VRPIFALVISTIFFFSAPASGDTPVPLTVAGNQATGAFALLFGIGGDLTISFEDAAGLTPGALDVSVRLASPLEPGLLARLPGPGVGLVVAFPVVLRIEPSEGSGLSFEGVVNVSLHTLNLHLLPNSPLALYSASNGGAFRDITASVASGSYRAGGSSGGFSEFLIVADVRPIDTKILGKFDRLEDTLSDHAASIPAAVLLDLQARLLQARTLWTAGSTAAAIAEVDGFAAEVVEESGTAIPNVWQAAGGPANVAGLLRAGADTLRFSLQVKAAQSP